jgi:hypothetical protein
LTPFQEFYFSKLTPFQEFLGGKITPFQGIFKIVEPKISKKTVLAIILAL